MEKIDFSNCEIYSFKTYGGANGSKISILYDDEIYMLKFPPKPRDNIELSYTNSCISEYLSCQILSTLGLDSQKTLLGTYKNKVVVACKDFAVDGWYLNEFAAIKNTIIDSERNGYGTELDEILETIENQTILPPEKMKKYFWNLFVADALLGNFDRHNGNWGVLTNSTTKETKLAPIYDCGSCLYPQADEDWMLKILTDPSELEKRIYTFPNSAIKANNRKINYFEYLTTTNNIDCLMALETMQKNIDLEKINNIVEDNIYLNETQKKFYKTMIKNRKERIVDYALTHNPNYSQNNEGQIINSLTKEGLEQNKALTSKELIYKTLGIISGTVAKEELQDCTFEYKNQQFRILDIEKEKGKHQANAVIENCETQECFLEKNFAGSNPFKLALNQPVKASDLKAIKNSKLIMN